MNLQTAFAGSMAKQSKVDACIKNTLDSFKQLCMIILLNS